MEFFNYPIQNSALIWKHVIFPLGRFSHGKIISIGVVSFDFHKIWEELHECPTVQTFVKVSELFQFFSSESIEV